MGYYRAGFEVVGVDHKAQPHYPFQFIQGDAMEFPLEGYDAYHASPPCQRYSYGTPDKTKHPDLISTVRRLLESTRKPWIIENVPGSPIRADFCITGDMTGLPLLRRERWFETNWWNGLLLAGKCEVNGPVITVTGHGTTSGNRQTWGRNIKTSEMRIAMSIEWMNRDELSEAIPPAYTEYIGKYLIEFLT